MASSMAALTGTHTQPRSPLDFIRSMKADSSAPESDATVSRDEVAAVYTPDAATLDGLCVELRAAIPCTPAGRLDVWYLRAALMARKGSVPRAAALLRNFAAWRARVGDGNLVSDARMEELLRSGLVVSPGTRDVDGRAIVWLRLRLMDMGRFTILDVVRMVAFVYEWTLRTYPWGMTHGISFLQDARGVRLTQLDSRVPKEMRIAFSQTLPIRVARLTVLSPPPFLALIVKVVQAFMGDKLKARMRLASSETELRAVAAPDQVPEGTGLGGTLAWTDADHSAWLARMEADCRAWPGIDLSPVEGQVAAAAVAAVSM